jgi:hypothetical protein
MNLRFRIDPLLAGEPDPAKRAEIWDRETRLICEEIARAAAAPFEPGGDESCEVDVVAEAAIATRDRSGRAIALPTRRGSPAGRRIRAAR